MRLPAAILSLLLLALAPLLEGRRGIASAGDFVNFESAQVHPLAFSDDARQLYAVNTPEGRLAIFDVGEDGVLVFAGDVPVGLEPVSLAVHPGTGEVWVVNHLSDTVSVVDVSQQKLVATLEAGDEPTDVAFAAGRAFVSLAGREDRVRVWDAATRADVVAFPVFGDDPRALAVSPDGSEVYLVVLESGNRTISLTPGTVQVGPGAPPESPPPNPNLPPVTNALIVQFNVATGRWEDEAGQNWSPFVDLELPDYDVFVIDAAATPPAVVRTIAGAGTTLYDGAVNPATGKLYVPNTDARNLIRFAPNLLGHLVDTRVSIVDPASGQVDLVDLNPHIDYGVVPGPPEEVARSLSQPGDGVFTADGAAYYLTALGSDKVGVLNGFTAEVVDLIGVGSGPSGVALDEADERLYVLNRFSNTISIVDTRRRVEIGVIGVAGPSRFDPSPPAVRDGRRFLYDGGMSAHGDIACSTCHVFGNYDGLPWDLGDPTGDLLLYSDAPWVSFTPDPPIRTGFHPLKGPMTTQTLRGIAGHAPFHWRGDRRDLLEFNANFVILLGHDTPLSAPDMDAFAAFLESITFQPNPYRTLADELPATIPVLDATGGGQTTPADPVVGEDLFDNVVTSFSFVDGVPLTCADCHTHPAGTNNTLTGAPLDVHDSKTAHMRNIYEKLSFSPIRASPGAPNIGAHLQKGALGVLHHGAVSLTEFLAKFLPGQVDEQHDLAAFMIAFPTESAPAVGRQVTVTESNKADADVAATLAVLLDQASAGRCDVVAHGVLQGTPRGYLWDGQADAFVPDVAAEPPVAEGTLRGGIGPGDVLTYMGVPPGTGRRSGLDRDRDTWRDGDERANRTDPADPVSVPIACTNGAPGGIERARLTIARMHRAVPRDRLSIQGRFTLPTPLAPSVDPAANGFNFKVVDAAGNTLFHRSAPPGEAASRRLPGWKTTANRWVFRDRTGASTGGVTRVVITYQPSRDPGLFTFRITGKRGGFGVDAGDLPVGVAVLAGATAQDAAGQCAGVQFGGAGDPSPACRLSADSERLACR